MHLADFTIIDPDIIRCVNLSPQTLVPVIRVFPDITVPPNAIASGRKSSNFLPVLTPFRDRSTASGFCYHIVKIAHGDNLP